jgi:hypothetical protein
MKAMGARETEVVGESGIRKCYGCRRELPAGVRFCVRCGKNNFDPDDARLAMAQFEMGSQSRKSGFARIVSGLRWALFGIRR